LKKKKEFVSLDRKEGNGKERKKGRRTKELSVSLFDNGKKPKRKKIHFS